MSRAPHAAEVRGKSRPRAGNDVPRLVKLLGARDEVPVSGPRGQRIAQIAQAQRGRVARWQLLAAGLSSSTVGRLVKGGRLFPIHRGVFAVGHTAPMPLGDETAALLAVSGTSVLSHFSALALWGMIDPSTADGMIHVALAEDRRCRITGVTVHRNSLLKAGDVRIRQGLPVVSPAHALLDVAPVATDRQLELAFDRAVVERILRPVDVADLLARAWGRHGRRRLIALLERQHDSPSLTRSEAEERMLALIRAAQLPRPAVNARFHGYEIDFLWREQGFAIEVDGFRFHSTRTAFERDRRKDVDLRRFGVEVMRVTWRQLEDEPYALVARAAEGLARCATQAA